MNECRRILILIAVSIFIESLSIIFLYHTSQQRASLVETAQSQARLIEARFGKRFNKNYQHGSTAVALSLIIDAHENYKGFGETGEFTLSRKEGDLIVFHLSHPFIKAGLISWSLTVVIIVFGVWFFLRVSNPLILQLENRTYQLENLNRNMAVEIARRKKNDKRVITGFDSIVTDITAQKRSEEDLARELRVNGAIAKLSSSLIIKKSLEDISYITLETVNNITGSKYGYVGYIDQKTGFLVSVSLTKDIWDTCKVNQTNVVFEHFTGLFGWVLNNRTSLLTNDPGNDPRSSGSPEWHIPISRFISAPAIINNELVGQVALANKKTDYCKHDLDFIERVATLYAIAVQRHRAENELADLNYVLENCVRERTAELEAEVAERKGTERKLRQSETMLQTVFDGIGNPLIMLGKDMIVEVLNKAAIQYYGVEQANALGKPCYLGLQGRNTFCEGCTIPACIQERQTNTFERTGLFNPEMVERVTVYPIQKSSVEAGAIMFITDITQCKKMQMQLMRADRLSALGQFAGGIAHEIRNPMGSIRLFTDILCDENRYKRDEKEKELFDEINQNISRINSIIKSVLNYSKPLEISSGKADINNIISSTLKLFSSKLRNLKIDPLISLGENIKPIDGDPVGLQQVVTNMIINAMDAMKDGGILNIQTLKNCSTLDGNHSVVKIIVKDTGTGIPPDEFESIFNPFFSAKPGGTGLGLSISHHIIEIHGGTISVRNKKDGGAEFTIELPK